MSDQAVRSVDLEAASTAARMPWSALLSLATAAFITILTEALPAGVLPQISQDLDVSESLAGQFVTLYALGCVLATIPLARAVRRFPQKTVILVAIGGFAVINTATAISSIYALTLAARFIAGAISGLLWAQVAGQAGRISPSHLRGRAIAIAMLGIPAALSFGIPAGTLIGLAVGWRATFGIMSGMSVLLIGWVGAAIPNLPREEGAVHAPVHHVLAISGLPSILFAMTCFVLAHNILYTYIAPFLAPAGLEPRIGVVLLAFGVAALVGMFATGAIIDRHLRSLTIASIAVFLIAALALALDHAQPVVVIPAIIAWGLAFGGAPALYQTASAHVSGRDADVAQSIIVTVWNAAIAGGGILGGFMLSGLGLTWFAWSLVALLSLALIPVISARRYGLPS